MAKQGKFSARLILWLVLLIFVVLTQASPVQAQPAPAGGSDFYGLNFVAPYEPWLTLARESGARVVRWQFNWRDHEVAPGQWDWTRADGPIQAWQKTGIKVHAILHNPPDFAKANPGGLVPANIHLSWDHPDNGWARYCFKFAERYRGQIDSYEIWNEPDLVEYWEGTQQEYVYLLKGCYRAIKAADPGATVAMGGLALTGARTYLPGLLRLIAADPDAAAYNDYFDVVAIHMYFDPHHVYQYTTETRRYLEDYGMGDKPIWITETNVPLRGAGVVPDAPRWGFATEEEAAWYILQAISNAYAAGAERLMFFRLADDDMDIAYGLVRNDGTPRPSYYALQLAATYLYDIVETEREVYDHNLVIITMHRADGARIVTLYTKAGNGSTVRVPAEATAALLFNAAGGYSVVEADDSGIYTVTLPAAPERDLYHLSNYSVGGPLLMIVEQDQDAPTAMIEVSPVPLDEMHVLLRWQGDDGQFGTGIEYYELEVSHNGGPWTLWGGGQAETETVFDLSEGGTYAFRVRAVDKAGNVGEFSEPVEASYALVGTLVGQVVDLRGQGVPFSRVQLGDGSLHDADEAGRVRIDLPPGTVRIKNVDGSAHGQAEPPPVEIVIGQETIVTWLLLPLQDLIHNGSFDFGMQGWAWSSPDDVEADVLDDRTLLRLSGQRRPWGSPAAIAALDVPPGMEEGVLSFCYRMPEDGQVFRVRAVTDEEQMTLWQVADREMDFVRVWIDMERYTGRRITLRFELWGEKGASPGMVEIDDVIFGHVPVLDE